MLTWRTVGMHVPSSFSSAICVRRMQESRRTAPTKLDQVYTCIYMYMCVYHCINRFNCCKPDDLLRELVFFNTFEELKLPIKGPVEDAEVIKLYEPSPTPCLYVAPAENMVGRVPLMPLFLAGNATPTIPHLFSKHKDECFPMGCADTASVEGRRGSNVYEVNPWLWRFGRGKPRLGGLSVEATELRLQAHRQESHARGVETLLRHKAQRK